ncbi:glycosyltransferase family 4 protein [Flavobacterium jejuense]|uniref:Glycosyltransferase family 4 protein n=1 Tax=Flavobacterium jejuense TaxID=1544455 RepID=A0ABX0IUG1_9FLAO|nr:glycosyltransferase family 4 protein [Flavobacterium jejuense]NHN26173.1 glycosyltransferase family 4 protein [Flavobacterium jejuense]
MKSKTIAIYSGEIPSTTFIERLIVGLCSTGSTIYLFGKQKKKISYAKNVQLVTYSNRFSKVVVLLKYAVLLSFFKPKEKHKLDQIITSQKGDKQIKKLKYYPVLYHKPDIFHLQWAKGVEDWLWVKEFGIKFVLSLRGTHISISPIGDAALKQKYQANFLKVDGFHGVSKAIIDEASIYEANLKNATVIYSGLDVEKLIFKPKTKINSELKILSIGRSHWVKGYAYALDAFSYLKQEGVDFHYTIVGLGNDEELLFQRNQLDLETVVTFCKSIPFNQIVDKIQNADILLLPSLEEGIANVVLEAMALGTLVISTDCGGMQEVVKDGENGYVVPVRSARAIADTILEVRKLTLADYNEMTKKARLTVEKQHSNKKMISDFNSFYDIVLNKELS